MIILFCDLPGTSLKVGGSVHLLLKHVEDHVPQVLPFNLLPYTSLAIVSGITLAILSPSQEQIVCTNGGSVSI